MKRNDKIFSGDFEIWCSVGSQIHTSELQLQINDKPVIFLSFLNLNLTRKKHHLIKGKCGKLQLQKKTRKCAYIYFTHPSLNISINLLYILIYICNL